MFLGSDSNKAAEGFASSAEPSVPKRGQNLLLKPPGRSARVRVCSMAGWACGATAARGPLSLRLGISNQTARSVEPSRPLPTRTKETTPLDKESAQNSAWPEKQPRHPPVVLLYIRRDTNAPPSAPEPPHVAARDCSFTSRIIPVGPACRARLEASRSRLPSGILLTADH